MEKKIVETLNNLVEELVERSPFFRSWKPDLVDSAISTRFLISFDTLVKSFPGLIAAGIARMTDEESRTVLAVNLYQECGEGDTNRTHYAIYRKFLATTGIDISIIQENDFAAEWRKRLLEYINDTESIGAVIGVLGAGEFLAQPALGQIYPLLKTHYPQADQEYFTKHLELETEHVREITDLISKQDAGEVLSGSKFGLSVWETYFNQLADFIVNKQPGMGNR